MSKFSPLCRILVLLLLSLLLAPLARAQVYSSIVGFNTITALGNSDTRFSVPLHRPSVYQGLVQSVSSNSITVQGLPDWTANQFVYSAGSQTNTYYVSVGSGNKEGMYYTITANSEDSGIADTSFVTIDTAGEGDLIGAKMALVLPS
ncbi:MAG: TIGR02597 family protein [Prosthecobacter sp.]